jgi:pilus assembly protein Flp/PilA
MNFIQQFMRDESGATSIEYAVIGSLVSVAIIVSAGFLSREMKLMFDFVAASLGSRN